ncbi:deoxyribose-phosphate aldolase [Taibaiella soli]|uniref:Deoxyribose-phosphate aldolase n=1 Tax=Taibaiella soli TaxID=1649169 RepID=A0A2W2AGQ2_9BACT|nr:deoxyribose-phosphate aldolase [Taibaiella soli]PZF74441.1 deoxyribose-phosphate aldolase [Taibaiella soli]
MHSNIASYIDHTILKPTTTVADIKQLCEEAIQYSFAAVCVPPYFVKMAKQLLEGSPVKTATVIGFPFGYSSVGAKQEEIRQALADGVDELDIVHNIAALKNNDWTLLEEEIGSCTKLAHNAGKKIKVIIESGELTDAEIIACCQHYAPFGIDFMKTSTGYAPSGASIHAVQLMRSHLSENIEIKASGGIRSFAAAQEMIDAGATRIGCSAGVQIVKEATAQ